MSIDKIVCSVTCVLLLALSGCSRQQSDWQKTRESNTTEAYEQFLKKYPNGEFTAQAQARAKELYEERDWQKARDADTPDAYQAFLKQYPEGKWTEEARIRVENFTLAQAPAAGAATSADGPNTAGVDATPGSDGGAAAVRSPAGAHAAAGPGGSAGPAGVAGAGTSSSAGPRERAVDTTPPVPARTVKSEPPVVAAPAGVATRSARPHAVSARATAHTAAGPATYAVQLGAFKSGAGAASRHWADLKSHYPSLLTGLSPHVLSKSGDVETLHRLQATGLSEKRARGICTALKAAAQACLVVPPVRG